MQARSGRIHKAVNAFGKFKVMTIVQLATLLACSQRTVQRYLQQLQAIASFNRNASYYTLPRFAQFDEHGIWRYHGAFFSRFGNLTDTVYALICNSAAGLTARELGEMLGLQAHSFMWQVTRNSGLCREKIGGRFVYFASDQTVHDAQRRERFRRRAAAATMPPDQVAVQILVAAIKNPKASSDELAVELKRQHFNVTAAMIETVFEHHGLQKKTERSA